LNNASAPFSPEGSHATYPSILITEPVASPANNKPAVPITTKPVMPAPAPAPDYVLIKKGKKTYYQPPLNTVGECPCGLCKGGPVSLDSLDADAVSELHEARCNPQARRSKGRNPKTILKGKGKVTKRKARSPTPESDSESSFSGFSSSSSSETRSSTHTHNSVKGKTTGISPAPITIALTSIVAQDPFRQNRQSYKDEDEDAQEEQGCESGGGAWDEEVFDGVGD
ncbi:MAG: hypothetical protein Q9181_008349, partial [Wetmoreana brouardii]